MDGDSFHSRLKTKCENFLVLSPTNLYLCSGKETTSFLRLQTPAPVTSMIERIVHRLARRYAAAKTAGEPQRALLYTDPFRMGYLAFPVSEVGAAACTLVFGPVAMERLSKEEIRYIGHEIKLGSENCLLLETFLSVVPFYEREPLITLAGILLDYFETPLRRVSLSFEEHTVEPDGADEAFDEKFEQHGFVTRNYAVEGKMLRAVEHGDVELIRNNFNLNMRVFNLPVRYPNDPLREMKNLSITANSILLRAAISGGLNPSLAHNLSHSFAVRIEQQTSVDAMHDLIREIAITFAEAVRNYTLKNYSELVANAIILIHRNLTSPLSLTALAEELHVSREHLCRRFRQEAGMTLTEYVHRAKIRESCHLLASRKYDVGRIAFLFGYSSPSHYTKTFIRYQGISPHAWQQQQQLNKKDVQPPG